MSVCPRALTNKKVILVHATHARHPREEEEKLVSRKHLPPISHEIQQEPRILFRKRDTLPRRTSE
jgi:hypothetical protein